MASFADGSVAPAGTHAGMRVRPCTTYFAAVVGSPGYSTPCIGCECSEGRRGVAYGCKHGVRRRGIAALSPAAQRPGGVSSGAVLTSPGGTTSGLEPDVLLKVHAMRSLKAGLFSWPLLLTPPFVWGQYVKRREWRRQMARKRAVVEAHSPLGRGKGAAGKARGAGGAGAAAAAAAEGETVKRAMVAAATQGTPARPPFRPIMVTTRASAFVGLHYLIYGNIMAARFPNEFFNTPDAKPESITMATQISHRAAAGVALALMLGLPGRHSKGVKAVVQLSLAGGLGGIVAPEWASFLTGQLMLA